MFKRIYTTFYYVVTIPYMMTLTATLFAAAIALELVDKAFKTATNKMDPASLTTTLDLKRNKNKLARYILVIFLLMGVYFIVITNESTVLRVVGYYLAVVSVVKLWELNVKNFFKDRPDLLNENPDIARDDPHLLD